MAAPPTAAKKEVLNVVSVNVVCPPGSFAYTVKPGDTFFLLAQRFGTTVAAIAALNPTVNPNNLQIGSTLCIPGGAPGVCPPGSFAYIVKPGDTFFLLAQRFGTTVAAIAALNPTVNPNNLQIGSTLCIPGAAPGVCPSGSFAYTVQPGDTFFSLAQRFNTTVAAIAVLNPTVNPNNLQIGSTLCIPGVVPPPITCPTGSFAYTVQPGDTLFVLAQRFNTTVQAILALNPGVDPNNLVGGSTLCIPGGGLITCPQGTSPYTVQGGDTLTSIAQKFNTTVAAIVATNPGITPENLQVGQRICIPGGASG